MRHHLTASITTREKRLLTDYGHFGSARVILVPDLVGHANGLQTFRTLGLGSHVHEYFLARVQDEAVALIHGRHRRFHLPHANVFLALDLVELFLARCVDLRMVKSGVDSARQVTDRWTEGEKHIPKSASFVQTRRVFTKRTVITTHFSGAESYAST